MVDRKYIKESYTTISSDDSHIPFESIRIPLWMSDANCAGEIYTYDDDTSYAHSLQKIVCGNCIVQEECLEYAMEREGVGNNARSLVYGGKTPRERSRLAKRRATRKYGEDF